MATPGLRGESALLGTQVLGTWQVVVGREAGGEVDGILTPTFRDWLPQVNWRGWCGERIPVPSG